MFDCFLQQRYAIIHNAQCTMHNFVKMAQHFCKNGTYVSQKMLTFANINNYY